MGTPEEKIWLNKEADRLLNYQHQHRGLSFLKLRLPPTTDRKVNLVGLDNHIYRGSIPKLPEDKLPANVDEKSIDEEALYKEIRDMNFPPVPPQEPLGPRRRIGGSYTLTKRMALAPVKVDCGKGLEEIQILGKDGGIYKGVAKHASKLELVKQIRGTKRSIQVARQQSSSRGFIEPSLVTLQKDGQSKPFGRREKSFVELPAANVGKIIELILSQNKKTRGKNEITTDKIEPQLTEEKDDSHSEQTEETKDTEENVELKEDESEETESTEESEDTESKEESEDTESKEDSEDTESKEESEEKENKEESEEKENKEESEDTENKEESEDKENKEESEDTENKEESEDTENKEQSEDEENKEESEDEENKEESEATEGSEV